ncbi:hypothetical protein FC82_GL001687 [Secundilactobacillus collinoides DSM 20515 = JCM 1123]|uniref:Mga helix-turn-helix domain-containing protein n=2 Tax=Secundilactobacillus collinoides TaxID=33960 RepID=A0A0R2BB11_SECCO|nr:hypothetical protein FC82_GL001687 [Secundilactobacillus collinoides DSM 20515 = JCM 1123]
MNMDYLAFLEKDDQLKLKLIWLLETAHEHQIPLKTALSQLSVTRYKLNKIIARLEIDFQTQPEVDQSTIILKDGVLYGEHLDFSVYRVLQLAFLKRSIRFQIFEYEYMAKSNQSRQKFFEEHYISQAKYYLLRNEIDDLLANAVPLDHSNTINVHPELVMRSKLTNIYYYFYSGMELPFPELKKVTSKFIGFCAMTLGISMTPTQKAKLSIFFQVQVKRINSRNFINLRQLMHVQRTDQTAFIKNFYLNNVELAKEDDVTSEAGYLSAFLLSEHVADVCPTVLNKSLTMELGVIKDRFEKLLRSSALIDQSLVKDDKLSDIATHLSLESYWMLLFDLYTTPDYYEQSETRYSEDFPGFAMLASQMTREIRRILDLTVNYDIHTKLNHDYLMALIGLVPHDIVRDTVTVCVDFGQCRIPQQYIDMLLASYPGGNVKFVDYFSNDTDIYLSDTFVADIRDVPQVVWPDPMQLENFESLHRIVTEIKKNKINASLSIA